MSDTCVPEYRFVTDRRCPSHRESKRRQTGPRLSVSRRRVADSVLQCGGRGDRAVSARHGRRRSPVGRRPARRLRRWGGPLVAVAPVPHRRRGPDAGRRPLPVGSPGVPDSQRRIRRRQCRPRRRSQRRSRRPFSSRDAGPRRRRRTGAWHPGLRRGRAPALAFHPRRSGGGVRPAPGHARGTARQRTYHDSDSGSTPATNRRASAYPATATTA